MPRAFDVEVKQVLINACQGHSWGWRHWDH